jgi:hypothetical protein
MPLHHGLEPMLEPRLPLLQLLAKSEEMMGKSPQETLTLFATAFLTVVDNPNAIALVKLMLGEAVRQPLVAALLNTLLTSHTHNEYVWM